jgi:hypothetical protein
MFTSIVTMYMCYVLGLPTWCKVLMWISMVLYVCKFTWGLYKAGLKDGKQD